MALAGQEHRGQGVLGGGSLLHLLLFRVSPDWWITWNQRNALRLYTIFFFSHGFASLLTSDLIFSSKMAPFLCNVPLIYLARNLLWTDRKHCLLNCPLSPPLLGLESYILSSVVILGKAGHCGCLVYIHNMELSEAWGNRVWISHCSTVCRFNFLWFKLF